MKQSLARAISSHIPLPTSIRPRLAHIVNQRHFATSTRMTARRPFKGTFLPFSPSYRSQTARCTCLRMVLQLWHKGSGPPAHLHCKLGLPPLPVNLDLLFSRIALTAETEADRPTFDRESEFHLTQTPQVAFKAGGGLNDLVSRRL